MIWQDIHQQLIRLQDLPPWGRQQSDQWDAQSRFVYHCLDYEQVIETLNQNHATPELRAYTLHRWFNFWSAKGVELLFAQCPGVVPHPDVQNKHIDFSINEIAFDHKTTVFPKYYPKDKTFAQQHPQHLIEWLYTQQSKQQRFHQHNRLFIVLYEHRGQHWRLRKELPTLAVIIRNYVEHFDPKKLMHIHFGTGAKAFSDLIWFCD